jgi:hypothetical protein
MKRIILLIAALGTMAGVVAIAFQQQQPSYPYLDWAKQAAAGKPTTAVVLEFGLNDANARDWSGAAVIRGAKVVHREGYRFRSEDKLLADNAWEASSHRALRAPKAQPAISKIEPIASVGVVLHLQDVEADAKLAVTLRDGEKAEVRLDDVLAGGKHELWNGAAVVRLLSTAQPVAVGKTEDDMPAAAYGPDGTLWVAYVSYHVREDDRRIEPPQLKEQPDNFKKYSTPEFGDQVMLRSYKNGKWGEPIALTDPNQSIARCAIAVTGKGDFWVAYSAQRQGNSDIYARPVDARGRFGDEQRLTMTPGPDLSPTMCTDSDGNVWLAAQSWTDQGEANILVQRFADGRWNQSLVVRGTPTTGNNWNPALAAGPNGLVAVAYDRYYGGNYDVQVVMFTTPNSATVREIAMTRKFEARPAVVYDKTGRLWIAYEEGPENWGKDYGALDSGDGKPLYNERNIRVVCLGADGKLKKAVAELPTSRYDPPVLPFEPIKTAKFERATRYAYPKLGLDGAGNVWLAYRQNFGTRYTSHPGAYWMTFARRIDGDVWNEPIEVHHSDGLLDHRPVLLPHASGGLLVVHNTDGRFTTPEVIDNQIYASVVSLPPTKDLPRVVAHSPGQNMPSAEDKAESAAVQRMRSYGYSAAGKTYYTKRGEYHRHTEISWDGSPDGSLEDMFRYAIDAVRFDWIGNGDHDNGAGREYSWWLTQKFTDAYAVRGRFTPMFTYERSVSYPHGHRNVMFAQRGIRTLPRLAAPPGTKAEGGVHADDTKMLYRYLREFNGICAVHTSATGMGTDWRDNDPVVEPIVEIYQGDRMSYEHEGAPRAGYDPKTGKEPGNVAGWFPKGFINLALQKGYKLGFQASSDHWSTHISFFVVLVEPSKGKSIAEDRQAVLDAVKKRHCYGATDNILVDFRCGEAIMGDATTVNGAPSFSINVQGTAPLDKIDMLRDSEVVATLKGKQGPSFAGTWTDPQPQDGTHYYYIRALQADGEIAWASPIWVEKK